MSKSILELIADVVNDTKEENLKAVSKEASRIKRGMYENPIFGLIPTGDVHCVFHAIIQVAKGKPHSTENMEPDCASWKIINRRRCKLIDKKIANSASPDELQELDELQGYALDYLNRVAPVDTRELEKLESWLASQCKGTDKNGTFPQAGE